MINQPFPIPLPEKGGDITFLSEKSGDVPGGRTTFSKTPMIEQRFFVAKIRKKQNIISEKQLTSMTKTTDNGELVRNGTPGGRWGSIHFVGICFSTKMR